MRQFKNLFSFISATILLSYTAPNDCNAQTLKTPIASPTQTLKQAFALSDISIEYSRPSVKGRTIFGDLVPFGKIWRTGANASTKITFGDDVTIEGKDLPAGTYALYTIPNKETWEIMFYKDITLGGNVAGYKPENEAIRLIAKASPLMQKIETFTMNVAEITSNTCVIELLWERTRVVINVKTEIDSKILKNIETALNPVDTRPFFQAASYYYENDRDMDQALDWANKAIEQNNKAFWVYMLKAKIQYKAKDYAGSVTTANKVIEMATEAQNEDYIKLAEKLIIEAKKGR